MLSKILGGIWILLGILWFAKPQVLRDRLKRKMARKIKWIIFGFILVFGFSLLGSIIKAEGLFLKIVGIAGLIIVVKAILLVTTKTSDKMTNWWQDRPLIFFRFWGLFFLATGLGLFLAQY